MTTGKAKQQQIPYGDDNKKSKSNGKSYSYRRSPSGMTTRKAGAAAGYSNVA